MPPHTPASLKIRKEKEREERIWQRTKFILSLLFGLAVACGFLMAGINILVTCGIVLPFYLVTLLPKPPRAEAWFFMIGAVVSVVIGWILAR